MNDSFDRELFLRQIRSVHERNIKVFIKARIKVPGSVTTEKVRLYCGEDFRYKGYDGERFIVYNDMPKTQYLKNPLVPVKKDTRGTRYVAFAITFFIYTPYRLASSSQILPDKYLFKIAPDEEGYKKKFQKAKIYMVEE